MKKINAFVFSVMLLALASGLMSCKKKMTTSDGIEYTYIKEGGSKPTNGDYVIYNLVVKTDKDSVFISTYDSGMPGYHVYSDSLPTESGIEEIIMSLSKGDSITVVAKAEKVFGENNLPPFLKKGQDIKIQLGVVDVTDQVGIETYFSALQEAQIKKMEANAIKQLDTDKQLIESYLKDNNIQASQTESGLYYVIEKAGAGPAIETGDVAFVHYAGYLLDGTIFDTSVKEVAQANGVYNEQRDMTGNYTPLEVAVGQGRVIPGWDEGLGLLKKGDKAKFFIPSTLAYGERGAGGMIKPNSVLIFDVEITDVQK